MNFQTAKQNTGNRTEINAQIVKVWPEETTKNNKRKQDIDVSDGAVTLKVTNWINSNYPCMTASDQGREGQWIVSHSMYANKDQYSGWPTGKPNTIPLPVPQPAQDAPKSNEGKPDWDKIARGKVMCNVVCAAIQGGQFVCKSLDDAKTYTDYIMGNDFSRRIDDLEKDPY